MKTTVMILTMALLGAGAHAAQPSDDAMYDTPTLGVPDTPEHACANATDATCEEMKMQTNSEVDLIASLDPGIREVVAFLRMRGHETTDSGDGKTKFALGDSDEARPEPHVVIRTDPDSLLCTCSRVTEDLESQGVHVVALGPDGVAPGHAVVEGVYMVGAGVAIVEVTHLDDAGLRTAQQAARAHADSA